MSREAFEQWYVSLHGSDIDNLAVWGKDSPWYSKDDYELISTRNMYQAWQAATEAQQARIDDLYTQLEQAQADRNKYGVHLSAALKGEKRKDEPVDGRLDAVREMREALQELLEAYYAIGGNPLDGVAEDARDVLGLGGAQ